MAALQEPMTAEQMQAVLDDPAGFLAKNAAKYEAGAPNPAASRSREEQIEAMRAHLDNVKKLKPEVAANLEGKGEWYIPGIDFNVEVRERLSEEHNRLFNNAMAKTTKAMFDPAVFVEVRPQVVKAFEGNEDLLVKYDEMFDNGEKLRGMHEYLTKTSSGNKDVATEESKVETLPVPVVD